MKWSWKLGTVAGIGLYVHGTFLLLLGWVGLSHWIEGGSAAAALAGVGFVVALFACVVLHELGHALTAQRFGIRTRDITLLPIGGVARLERMPDDPRQEVAVALAGPAVNVVIAAALYLWLSLSETLRPLAALSVTGGPVLQRLMVVNLSLAVFNLLPAFPMDGGRVLRALLAMRMDYTRATQLAAQVGQAMALLFGFVGLFANPFLLFIAFFVWIGAAQEASMVQMRSALGGIPVSRAMLTDFETLAPGDPGRRVLDLIIAGSQSDFPVVEDGRVVGVLLRRDVLNALAQHGQDWRVGDVMRRDFEVVEAGEMLETAFARLQRCACHALPVTSRGALVGLVTMDNLGEFLLIQSALGRARGRRAA
ncbi:MAG: site-2 protease family protein [Gemmatimonadetes bacterium]|nr:MAG: site-2 protease family protein [Gemmatimonadota bacterium]